MDSLPIPGGDTPMTPRAARIPIAILMAFLLLANALAWLWAWQVARERPALMGTALLAWMFGLRHALDADHIAAIDNVVRVLVREGRRAWDGGLFFAPGHSTVVLIACLVLLAFPAAGGVEAVRAMGEGWGTVLSAAFLFAIALANLMTLRRIWRTRHGGDQDGALAGGVMTLVLRPVRRLAGRSWHMLPVGFLFGLGFDTASEIALLALTGQQTAHVPHSLDVLVFPALFTAGMVLIDTADSVVMSEAYAWASHHPGRKFWYNLAITAVSVCVALGVGVFEMIGLMDAVPHAGFAVVALLLAIWGIAALLLRHAPPRPAGLCSGVSSGK